MNRQYFLLCNTVFLFLQIKCFEVYDMSNYNENCNIKLFNNSKINLRKKKVEIWFKDFLNFYDDLFFKDDSNKSNNVLDKTNIKLINLNENFIIDDNIYNNSEEFVAYSKPIEKSFNIDVFFGGSLNLFEYLKFIVMIDLYKFKNNIKDLQYVYLGFRLQNVFGIMVLCQFYCFKNILITGCYKNINFGLSYNFNNEKIGIVFAYSTMNNFIIMFNYY